jgi:hypothetical protein
LFVAVVFAGRVLPGWWGGLVLSRVQAAPEGVHASATKVGTHADELLLRHTAADGRIEAARAAVAAGSAVALASAVAKRGVSTRVLVGSPASSLDCGR